jgi:ectoine hydroxylase-related dioxygenase (phytanoyl-CoA dioxygenase family)
MSRLSDEQIGQYWREGFLIVRNVIQPDHLDILRAECARLWQSVDITESNRRIQWRMRLDGGKTADRIDPVLDISPTFLAIAQGKSIIEPVAQLLRCSDAVVFKGKLISKWPQTAGYGMHQDYSYWRNYTEAAADCFLTALIAVDCFDADNGALEFFPRLHHQHIPPPSGNPNDADENHINLSTRALALMEPGDVAYFHSLTPHRSGPNRSRHSRQSLFLSFVTAEHDDMAERYYSGRPADFMGAK